MIEENIPLRLLTTFKLGGAAAFFVRISSVDEIRRALQFSREKNLRSLVLGGGSNVLIDDAGFQGLVLKIELRGIEKDGDTLIAASGESWDDLVSRAVSENLWGLENLSGIPGSVGGAIVGSIGAYGQAVAQTVLWVEALNCTTGEIKKFSTSECKFGYRRSFFSKGGYVVMRAAFRLSGVPTPDLSYKDLKARFGEEPPSLREIREAVLEIRKGKFPDLEVEGTAGSFFKNPILRADEAERLKTRYPEMPLFALPESDGIKIPLAWLLDHALSLKGERVGGARLFEKQPLVIVAGENATSRDVRELAERVQHAVCKAFGFSIEEEVRIVSV